jgi:hypothetical protein
MVATFKRVGYLQQLYHMVNPVLTAKLLFDMTNIRAKPNCMIPVPCHNVLFYTKICRTVEECINWNKCCSINVFIVSFSYFLSKQKDGSTALMCACEHGYANVVKKLLGVDGCDASIADHVSYSPSTPTCSSCRCDQPNLRMR